MDTQFWQSFEGQTVDGKYRLQSLLGNGAFGGVFLTHEFIGGQVIGQVAIKLILPISANQAAQLDELIAMRNLNHVHVVRGLAAGQCVLNNIKLLYLVMDVAEGTLESRLQAGAVSTAEAKEIVRSIADGLNFLHGKNMVHRDLKPGNVLRIGGQWQIADFGLIRAFGDDSAAYTQTVAGTPYFMPPESFSGAISPAWDVWSLGVLIVVAFTRQYPFTGASHHEVAQAIMTQEPRIASTLAPPFDAIVRGCLVKDRKARWTARQVLDALTATPVSVPVPPRQPTVTSTRTTRPQTLGGTQPTIPAAPVKRPAVPAGLWGLGGLLLGGIIVANIVSGHKPSASPTTTMPPAHHSSQTAGQTQVQQKSDVGEVSVAQSMKTRKIHKPQAVYDKALRRGLLRHDPEMKALGHELRLRGVIIDPTQGGLVTPPLYAKLGHPHVISRHTISRVIANAPMRHVTRSASIELGRHHDYTVASEPISHSLTRHAAVYHRTSRSSVGDLHSQSSIGNSSWHGNRNTASSDTSDSLH